MNTFRNALLLVATTWLSGCLLVIERKEVVDGSLCGDGESKQVFYADVDADGFGDPESSSLACELPEEGFSTDSTDCDDLNDRVHPEADEGCDGYDNDCDGQIDEDGGTPWYEDADGDGFGDESTEQILCDPGEGWVEADDEGFDCDDGDESIHPDSDELCSDSKDNDCDGVIDEDDAVDAPTWYADTDGDGFGDPESSRVACEQQPSEVADNTDCDDTDEETYPGAPEYCDNYSDEVGEGDEWGEYVVVEEIDSDCDGETNDADSVDARDWWPDLDGDEFGDMAATAVWRCFEPGWRDMANDCDDTDASVGLAPEYYTDADDDGLIEGEDAETVSSCTDPGEGWALYSEPYDCDDTDPEIGLALGYYRDDDSDGFPAFYEESPEGDLYCDADDVPDPFVAFPGEWDCDDGEEGTYPGAPEICSDEIDNDCDGIVDEEPCEAEID